MSEFIDVWKYWLSARYITRKGEREYFTRGTAMGFAFLFFLVIPLFIITSPIIYFDFRRELRKHKGIKIKPSHILFGRSK